MRSPRSMFLCVSANSAIDKRLRISEFRAGTVNRATEAIPEPGGKAAHVAMALRALGAKPIWIGFAGGATGKELVAGLGELGITARGVAVTEPTRVNLAILDDSGVVTEILEPGSAPSPRGQSLFRKTCERGFGRAKKTGAVIFSGSLPDGVQERFYADLIRSASRHGCRVFLDTSGEALRLGLKEHPDVVKPNREEAELLTGVAIRDLASARAALTRIHAMGAGSVALSLGAEGLLWCAGEGEPVLRARVEEITGRSAVGSGDAALAGIAHAMASGLDQEGIVRRAVACGAANCLVESPGRLRLADVRRLERVVQVETLPPLEWTQR